MGWIQSTPSPDATNPRHHRKIYRTVKFETALRALAEGNSLRATARIVEVDKDTVCAWLDRGARQCRSVILALWQNLPVTECQLGELWGFIQ